MPSSTLPFDDLLSRTRARNREDARGRTRVDHADEAWVALHRFGHHPEPVKRPVQRTQREGETIKFTLRLEDGNETESVILPMQGRSGRPRTTLCVSSQIGCAMGCGFCETAAMGLVRNLTPAEILAQWHAARFTFEAPISNIVFMGMGEPMENLNAVLQAIEVLTDRSGAEIAPSRISVSTVGRVSGIDRYRDFMAHDGRRQLRLAVSVNAPNETIRRSIMPITRADDLASLRAAMSRWLEAGGRTILVEYVLIPGVNDEPDHPRELARWLRGLDCRCNVIPYNPRRDSPWTAPSEASIDRFIATLDEEGCRVHRRRTMGRDVMAACGQLGNPAIRRRVRLRIPSS